MNSAEYQVEANQASDHHNRRRLGDEVFGDLDTSSHVSRSSSAMGYAVPQQQTPSPDPLGPLHAGWGERRTPEGRIYFVDCKSSLEHISWHKRKCVTSTSCRLRDNAQSCKDNAGRFILKNAWRPCGRLAESTVYKMINSAPKEPTSHLDGVAQFVDGGDIFDSQAPNEVVKVSSHRKGFGSPINEKDDPVLHRLVLASHGRSLSKFTNFSRLMRAAKKMNSGTLIIFDQYSPLRLF